MNQVLNFVYTNPTLLPSILAILISFLSYFKSREAFDLVKTKEHNETLKRKNDIIYQKIISIENAIEAYDKIKDGYKPPLTATLAEIDKFHKIFEHSIELIYQARRQSLIIYSSLFEITQFKNFNINLVNKYRKYIETEMNRLKKSNLNVTADDNDFKNSVSEITEIYGSVNKTIYLLMETSRHLNNMLLDENVPYDYLQGKKYILEYKGEKTKEEIVEFIKNHTKI